jgi:hypothetical protein
MKFLIQLNVLNFSKVLLLILTFFTQNSNLYNNLNFSGASKAC